MKSDIDRTIQELIAREPSPVEARALAQKALDDPDLFDTLVAHGAVEASLESPAVQAAVSSAGHRKAWVIASFAAAAAAVILAFVWREDSQPAPQPVEQARAVASQPAMIASLDATSGRPVVLASNLAPAASSIAPVFRGAAAPSREPQSNGIVVAVEDGEATVNLGSLDGLAKGTELQTSAGRIVISTVFRDRARGAVSPGAKIHAKDRVEVPPAVHLAAVSNEVAALAASGDLNQARTVARSALAAGSSGETRPLLARLAALDYQAGAIDAAREHYEAAANNLFQPPAASPAEQAATLNSLGALYLLRGDAASAVKPLNQADTQQNIDAALRAQILNNLGVLAEMQGDVARARDAYSRAAAFETAAQANLNRLSSLKK